MYNIILAVTFTIFCLFLATAIPSQATSTTWPLLFGTTGSYGFDSTQLSQMDDMKTDGHSIFILKNVIDPVFLQKLQDTQLKYIVKSPQQILYSNCQDYYATDAADPCLIDENAQLQTKVLNQLDNFLRRPEIATNSAIVGFYLLDDFPGDVHKTLELMKQKIAAAPAPFPRATICGMQTSPLSYKENKDAPFQDFFSSTDRALVNFSPKACDITVYYMYANAFDPDNGDPTLWDWEMKTKLPVMLQKTKEAGLINDPTWDPNTFIWGAIAQAFGSKTAPYNRVPPRYQDMLLQVNSYCKSGAALLMYFTWDDGNTERKDINNDPEIRQGAKDGAALCRRYWNNTLVIGDANGDGIVDILDYNLWYSYYTDQQSGGPSDFNFDGKIDGIDYITLITNIVI